MGFLKQYRLYSRDIYFWLLALLAVSLLYYRQFLVISQILLILNWLLEGNLPQKLKILYRRKSILIFLTIYVVHIIWMFGTSETNLGFINLFLKLPLIILPVIIGTSEPIPVKKFRLIMHIFILAVIFSTLFSALIFFGIIPIKFSDVREISIFISHIRLSLMVVVGIHILLYWLVKGFPSYNRLHLVYTISAIWLIYFLFLLKSLTGISILFISTFILIIINMNQVKNRYAKTGIILALIMAPIFATGYIFSVVHDFYAKDKIDFNKLEKYTVNGNPYINDTLNNSRENGHYVWLYYCPVELEREWNKRSKIFFNNNDLRNQPIKYTLIRYLTSMGLRKDSAGIWKMTNRDIRNVEKGMANKIFAKMGSIYPRIYEVVGEVDDYMNNGSVSGHSVVQRLVYIKMSLSIIKKNLFLGLAPAMPKKLLKTIIKRMIPGWKSIFKENRTINIFVL